MDKAIVLYSKSSGWYVNCKTKSMVKKITALLLDWCWNFSVHGTLNGGYIIYLTTTMSGCTPLSALSNVEMDEAKTSIENL